jgi:putative phosphoribosyl transferase
MRKVGAPGHDELAIGTVASGGLRFVNEEVTEWLRVDASELDGRADAELREVARRETSYRDGRPRPHLANRAVILIDDGLATGATMRVAILAVRREHPQKIVVAVPVASTEACASLAGAVDEMVCLDTPEPFRAVGLWYRDFDQTTDHEVVTLLRKAAANESRLDPAAARR